MTRAGQGLVSEAELDELLRPRRPDAQAFREGVASRIKAREAQLEAERQAQFEPEREAPTQLEREGQAGASAQAAHVSKRAPLVARRVPRALRDRPTLWRKVAAILPPDLAVLALKAGKGWSAAALLPALALVAVVSAFAASVGSISRSARNAAPLRRGGSSPPLDDGAGQGRHMALGAGLQLALQLGGLAVVALPAVIGARWIVDAIVGLLLLSMCALVVTLRGLSQSGLLERGAVLRLCSRLLSSVFVSCFLWTRSLRLMDGAANFGLDWGAGIVLGGLLVLLAVFRRSSPLAPWMLACWSTLLVAVMVLFPPSTTRSSPDDVRAYVEAQQLDAQSLSAWDEVSNSVEALAAVGARPPQLEHVRAELERAFDEDVDAHPRVWTAGARMGLVTREQWKQLSERRLEGYRLEQLLRIDGPLHTPDYGEYALHMLLAVRELSAREREHLAQRVAASWPDESETRALGRVAQCVRWMDLLGRGDWVDARRDDVQRVLVRHWVSSARGFDRPGGFTSDPLQFPTSFDDETLLGVELMARVGVPAGVDLVRVRGFLRAAGAWGGPLLEGSSYLKATERAALLRLERQIGLPEPSLLGRILAERALVGALLLVALCFVAVARTPVDRDPLAEARDGAQP